MKENLIDNSVIKFGKYKGKKHDEVPAEYLIWLHDSNKSFGDTHVYILANLERLRMEISNNAKGIR